MPQQPYPPGFVPQQGPGYPGDIVIPDIRTDGMTPSPPYPPVVPPTPPGVMGVPGYIPPGPPPPLGPYMMQPALGTPMHQERYREESPDFAPPAPSSSRPSGSGSTTDGYESDGPHAIFVPPPDQRRQELPMQYIPQQVPGVITILPPHSGPESPTDMHPHEEHAPGRESPTGTERRYPVSRTTSPRTARSRSPSPRIVRIPTEPHPGSPRHPDVSRTDVASPPAATTPQPIIIQPAPPHQQFIPGPPIPMMPIGQQQPQGPPPPTQVIEVRGPSVSPTSPRMEHSDYTHSSQPMVIRTGSRRRSRSRSPSRESRRSHRRTSTPPPTQTVIVPSGAPPTGPQMVIPGGQVVVQPAPAVSGQPSDIVVHTLPSGGRSRSPMSRRHDDYDRGRRPSDRERDPRDRSRSPDDRSPRRRDDRSPEDPGRRRRRGYEYHGQRHRGYSRSPEYHGRRHRGDSRSPEYSGRRRQSYSRSPERHAGPRRYVYSMSPSPPRDWDDPRHLPEDPHAGPSRHRSGRGSWSPGRDAPYRRGPIRRVISRSPSPVVVHVREAPAHASHIRSPSPTFTGQPYRSRVPSSRVRPMSRSRAGRSRSPSPMYHVPHRPPRSSPPSAHDDYDRVRQMTPSPRGYPSSLTSHGEPIHVRTPSRPSEPRSPTVVDFEPHPTTGVLPRVERVSTGRSRRAPSGQGPSGRGPSQGTH